MIENFSDMDSHANDSEDVKVCTTELGFVNIILVYHVVFTVLFVFNASLPSEEIIV